MAESLHIKPTQRTPEVDFRFDSGQFSLTGNSMPENSEMFYREALLRFDAYTLTPKSRTLFTFRLHYYNTSTARALVCLFEGLQRIHLAGAEVVVNWEYESDDPDMADGVRFYQEMVTFTIELVPLA